MKEKINIINYIPVGRENGISRKELCRKLNMNDRNVRRLIEETRQTSCICNMSDGAGYYIPEKLQDVDLYIRQENARIRSIFKSLKGAKMMKKLMEKENNNERI